MTKTIADLLRENGEVIRPFVGTSMLPMLDEKRDAVRIVPLTRELRVGDVPLFYRDEGHYTLHRVCEVSAQTVTIRGDNCYDFEKIPKDRFIGILAGFYKDGKYVDADDAAYRSYVARVLAEGKPLIPPVWRYLPALLRCAMTGADVPPVPEGVRVSDTLRAAKASMLTSVLSRAILRSGDAFSPKEQTAFALGAASALRREKVFAGEREKLYGALSQKKIAFVPLKGILISPLYPEEGMREFADNDILVDKRKLPAVRKIMTELGFSLAGRDGGTLEYQKPPMLNFEIHTELFPKGSPYHAYFAGILSRTVARSEDSYERVMSSEDFYLYFLAHFAKHYLIVGGGLRLFADLWVLKNKYGSDPAFRRDIFRAGLEALGLCDFYTEVSDIADGIFLRGEMTEKDMRYIIGGGAFGSKEAYLRSHVEKMGRAKYLFFRLLPPYREMAKRFPVLRRVPVLLPLLWIVRVFGLLFTPGRLSESREELSVLKKLK